MAKFKPWTDDQFHHATRQDLANHLRDIQTARDAQSEIFAHENQAKEGLSMLQAAMESGQVALRTGVGQSLKLGAEAGLADAHWASQDARDFRYNQMPMFHAYATYMHNLWEGMKLYGSKPQAALAHAFLQTEDESGRGFPWAKANPESVEKITMATADPYMYSGWAVDGLKAAGMAGEIKSITPAAKAVMEAARSGASDVILAAKDLTGADAGARSFLGAIRDMAKNNATVEDVAAWMHTQGFRTQQFWDTNAPALNDWFKRGWNLYSPRLKDAAMKLTAYREAILKEQQIALENVASITKDELPVLQQVLSTVPRESHDPVGTFVRNYAYALRSGKLPDGTPLVVPHLDPETLDKAKSLVSDLSAGWRGDSAWVPAYSPSKAKEGEELIGAVRASSGEATRTYRLHRTTYTPFDNVAEFREAVAKVKTRVFKADNVDEFVREVGRRISDLNGAIEKVWPSADSQSVRALNEKISSLKSLASGISDRMGQAFVDTDKATALKADLGKLGKAITSLKVDTSLPGLRDDLFHEFITKSNQLAHELSGIASAQRPAPALEAKAVVSSVLHEVTALEQQVKSLGTSLNGTGEAWIKSVPKDVRQLMRERFVLQRMVQDLKLLKDSADPLAQLAEKDPSGVAATLLKMYDRALRVYKIAELRLNPYYWFHATSDVIARSLGETGSAPMKELWEALKDGTPQFAKDGLGNKIDFGASPIELMYGRERNAGSTLGRFNQRLDSRLEAIHSAAYNHVGQFHFNKAYASNLKAGLKPELANERALSTTREIVDRMSGLYRNRPSVLKLLDRFVPWEGHYINRASHWVTLAGENPVEAYDLVKARKFQRDMSVDGRGALPLTDKLAFDPWRKWTGVQVMDSALDSDSALNRQEPDRYKLDRALQSLTGMPFPHVDVMLQAAGVKPASNIPPSKLTDAADFLSRVVSSDDHQPEPLQHLMGRNPDETPNQLLGRQVVSQMVAAAAAGKPISADEAMDRAKTQATINNLGAPLGLVYRQPGFEQVLGALADYRDSIAKAQPEDKAAMRQVIINEYEQKYPGISTVFPLDPESRNAAVLKRLNLEEGQTRGELNTPEGSRILTTAPVAGQSPDQSSIDTGKEQRFGDLIDAAKGSAMGTLFQKVYNTLVPDAGATEVTDDRWKDRMAKVQAIKDGAPAIAQTVSAMQTPVGARPVFNSDGTALGRADATTGTAKLQMIESNVRQIESVQGVHDYLSVKAAQDPSLIPTIRQLQDKPGMGMWRAAGQAYDYVNNGYKGPLLSDELPGVKAAQVSVSQAFRNAVMADPSLIRKSPDQVRAQLAADGKSAAVGTSTAAWDNTAISLAQQAAVQTAAIASKQKLDAYPEAKGYLDELKSATYRSPYSIPTVIDKGVKMVGDQLPTDFFEQLRHDQGGLWGDMTTAYYRPELDLATKQLFPFGINKDINPVRLGEMLLDPHGQLLVGILRDHGAPQVTDKLNELATTPIPLHDGMTLDDLTSNRQQAFSQAIHDVDIRTGLQPDFQQVMQRVTAAGLDQEFNTPLQPHVQAPANYVESNSPTASAPASIAAPSPMAPPFSPGGPALPQMVDSFVHSSIQPTKSIEPPTYTPLTSRFYSTAPQILQGYSQYRTQEIAQARQIEIEGGHPEGSLTPNLFSSWVAFSSNPDGSASMDPLPAMGAAATLAQLGDRLAGDAPDSVAARSINGFSTALSSGIAAGTMATWLGAGAAAGPIGLAVGLAAGLATGLMKGKKQDNSEAMEMQRQRLALQREQFEEQQRKQSVSELQTRERTLAQAASTGTAQQRQQLAQANALGQFRVRPTYGSRIGMVDSVERELASALKPHW
jgi:hypothetical protein